MSANIMKNGIFNCTPIEGFNTASIMKNNIVVGKNLVTGNPIVYNSSVGSNVIAFYTSPVLSLKTNTNYTLSFVAWIDTPDSTLFQGLDRDLIPDVLPQSNLPFSSDGISNKKKRFVWTFSTSRTEMSYCNLRLFIDFANSAGLKLVAPIHIEQIKLEEGSKATPWCPSDSDNMGSIDLTYLNPIQGNEFYEV